MASDNQQISSQELADIRSLDDFDLTMLLSDIHDCGWPVAKGTLAIILEAHAACSPERYKQRSGH